MKAAWPFQPPKCALAAGSGLNLFVDDFSDFPRALFGETNGCFLVEVSPENKLQFEIAFAGLPIYLLGQVTKEPHLVIRSKQQVLIDLKVEQLVQAWQTPN